MAKHNLALDELRRMLNSLTRESKYAADRRNWLRENIQYDEDRDRKPEPKHIKELGEMTEKVKENLIKIESLTASIRRLEEDDA